MKVRNIVGAVVGLGCVLVVLSARHRRLVAEKLAAARVFISRRIVDREERATDAREERWEGEGGAMHAPRDAARPAT